jgi:hypothetical protein
MPDAHYTCRSSLLSTPLCTRLYVHTHCYTCSGWAPCTVHWQEQGTPGWSFNSLWLSRSASKCSEPTHTQFVHKQKLLNLDIKVCIHALELYSCMYGRKHLCNLSRSVVVVCSQYCSIKHCTDRLCLHRDHCGVWHYYWYRCMTLLRTIWYTSLCYTVLHACIH